MCRICTRLFSRRITAHPPRHRIAILVLVSGGTMREAGKRRGLRDSAAMTSKRRVSEDLIEFFGEDLIRRLLDGTRPGWESDLRMSREAGVAIPGGSAWRRQYPDSRIQQKA